MWAHFSKSNVKNNETVEISLLVNLLQAKVTQNMHLWCLKLARMKIHL